MGRETHAVEILTKEITQGRAEEETKMIYQKRKKWHSVQRFVSLKGLNVFICK